MVKLIAPLLSLNAKGKLGGVINYANINGKTYARRLRKPIAPYDPKTEIQLFNRVYFRNVVIIWQNLDEQERDYLNIYSEFFHMSGFNLFTKGYIEQHPTEAGMAYLGLSQLGDLVF